MSRLLSPGHGNIIVRNGYQPFKSTIEDRLSARALDRLDVAETCFDLERIRREHRRR